MFASAFVPDKSYHYFTCPVSVYQDLRFTTT